MKIEIPIEINVNEDDLNRIVDKMKQDGDFVLVVRCRECKHWKTNKCFIDHNDMSFATNADDFCSHGEEVEVQDNG